MRRLSLALAFVFAATVAGAVPVGPKGARWQPVDTLRQPQGLPQNTVMTIRQTRDGYLWVGTKGGVARFDGLRFTTWDDRDRTQLRENEVWALAEADDGTLWMGTYGGGVSRYKDGRFTVLTTRDGLVNDYVTDLCSDPTGAVWVATDAGISRYRDGRFTSYTVAEGLPHVATRSLMCDRDGSVWIGSTAGRVSRYEKGTIRPVDLPGLTARHAELKLKHLSDSVEVRLVCRDFAHAMGEAAALRSGIGGGIQQMTVEAHTLEDVFLLLTGRALRD